MCPKISQKSNRKCSTVPRANIPVLHLIVHCRRTLIDILIQPIVLRCPPYQCQFNGITLTRIVHKSTTCHKCVRRLFCRNQFTPQLIRKTT